ncbi:hypothetical protein RF11_08295 [Thelohanellus kitauei]|uniref:Uncharacterized protein n=1 Tax=Thelohanellus kitauei TaxID=669202 RepID=A0A0C2MM27_THEKT|nr:hypothetical protein RF11_08295 [Thelohanellus kitauei]
MPNLSDLKCMSLKKSVFGYNTRLSHSHFKDEATNYIPISQAPLEEIPAMQQAEGHRRCLQSHGVLRSRSASPRLVTLFAKSKFIKDDIQTETQCGVDGDLGSSDFCLECRQASRDR